MEKLVVTGGCGFIGSNFIRMILEKEPTVEVINFDLLTYAGNLANLKDLEKNPMFAIALWLILISKKCINQNINYTAELSV